jgi:NAD(P)-dependent dehydrogenase (short-subunit alcohol dehydrogenase family)
MIEEFGKVDILINCAGKITRAPTIDFPEDEWRSIMDTNVTGTLRACQIFGKHMLERGKELRMRTPMKRFGKTEELVGAAIYLASDASTFVAGEILVVDGGFLANGVNQ